MKKRILPVLLALVIVLGLLPLVALAADTAGEETYEITLNIENDEYGSVSVVPSKHPGKMIAKAGESVNVIMLPKIDAEKEIVTGSLKHYAVVSTAGDSVDEIKPDKEEDMDLSGYSGHTSRYITFTMPAGAVAIDVVFEALEKPIPLVPTTYSITIGDSENGAVTADKEKAAEGETVTLTVNPETGYQLDELLVLPMSALEGDEEGEITDDIELQEGEDGTYTFTMPDEDVMVIALFAETEVDPEPDKCTCDTKCTGESKDDDCPICKELSGDFAACKGTEPGKPEPAAYEYKHNQGLFMGQLVLSGLAPNSKYVCQMAKAGTTSAAGCAIVIVETGSDETTQTIEVLGNTAGYTVQLWKYPESGEVSSVSELTSVTLTKK